MLIKYVQKNIFTKIKFNNHFNWNQSWVWLILIASCLLRLFWSANFPIGNDEAYYWDWSRQLQLSYVDAPPFVAWSAFLGGLLFSGEIGVRLFIPIFYFFTTIFLILCAREIEFIKNKQLTNETVITILILTQLIPIFSLEGMMLIPDGPLLFGISGALFYLLKANRKALHKNSSLNVKNGLFLGLFLGIAGLSKYHALPISIGFFIATLVFRGIKASIKDYKFWFVTIFVSIVISSPVFVWNYNNNYASFSFQSQHGFSDFNFSFYTVFKFFLGISLYLMPWFFIPLFYFSFKELKKNKYYNSPAIFSIIPFYFLFLIILISSMGKETLAHWVMPGFLLLIPAFAINWKPLQSKYKSIWKKLFYLSFAISIIIPTLLSFNFINNFIIKNYAYINGNSDSLFQFYIWKDLENFMQDQHNIQLSLNEFKQNNLISKKCDNEYEIASLKWFWTAQMAFHFKHQPKIYNFDFNNSSFYTWRDKLYELAECKIIIVGSQDHFQANEIFKIMNVEEIKKFTLSPYTGKNIVFIKGSLKEEGVLRKIYENTLTNIRY